MDLICKGSPESQDFGVGCGKAQQDPASIVNDPLRTSLLLAASMIPIATPFPELCYKLGKHCDFQN